METTGLVGVRVDRPVDGPDGLENTERQQLTTKATSGCNTVCRMASECNAHFISMYMLTRHVRK